MIKTPINSLPNHFLEEKNALQSAGVTSWEDLRSLEDKLLLELVSNGRSSLRNLKKIRGIAKLICALNVSTEEAALLLHSGLSSMESIARSSPTQLIQQIGRLERQLNTNRNPIIDLAKAKDLIKQARKRQIFN